MGVIVPETFSLRTLANEAERRVVEAFRDRLNDGWLILPDVAFPGVSQDHQLDVVLINAKYGVFDIEVKGHQMEIKDGRWCHGGVELAQQPPAQAKTNAYALRNLLREQIPHLRHLHVHYGIALPNAPSIGEAKTFDLDRSQILGVQELEDPIDALDQLVTVHPSQSIDESDVAEIVRFLRPDVGFGFDPRARQHRNRQRLEELCATQVRALESLDANRKVIVTGAAGTGKTRLALAWTRRALARQERVLLTCYNEPLAHHLRSELFEDPDLSVGPFLRLALALPGMPPLVIPEDADHQWWTTVPVGHLVSHWSEVTERFDTIVIDEAQDFSPAWLGLLGVLLDPQGPQRTLMVGDQGQVIYERGFSEPGTNDGWTHAELTNNCRNALEISRLLRRKLGGAAAPAMAPEAVDLRFVLAEQDHSAVIDQELERLVQEERDPAQIMVLTLSAQLRDQLALDLGLQPWEQRDQGIVVQTVHRAKGLESDTVVLVVDGDQVDQDLLAVGVSRAVSELIIIGPQWLCEDLGLDPPH